jgi:hypothetical protein
MGEDCGLRPAWENTSPDPNSKITRAKWTGDTAQAVSCLLSKTKQNKTKHKDSYCN